jgi:hypothetical protein
MLERLLHGQQRCSRVACYQGALKAGAAVAAFSGKALD